MKAEITGGKNLSLDPSHRANQHRFDVRCMLPKGIRDGQRRHQVAASAAARDEDSQQGGSPLGGWAAGWGSNRLSHLSAGRAVLQPVVPAAPLSRCPAAPPFASPSAQPPGGCLEAGRY